MLSALDVARYLLAITDEEAGEYISHLKLQKLCYYAQGFNLARIASIVGCSRQTVQGWRNNEQYLTLRDEFGRTEIAELEPLIRRTKSELFELWSVHLVPYLKESLEAVDDDKKPAWLIRDRAARIIANVLVQSGVLGNHDQEQSNATAQSQAVVAVYFPKHGEAPLEGADVIELDGGD